MQDTYIRQKIFDLLSKYFAYRLSLASVDMSLNVSLNFGRDVQSAEEFLDGGSINLAIFLDGLQRNNRKSRIYNIIKISCI